MYRLFIWDEKVRKGGWFLTTLTLIFLLIAIGFVICVACGFDTIVNNIKSIAKSAGIPVLSGLILLDLIVLLTQTNSILENIYLALKKDKNEK